MTLDRSTADRSASDKDVTVVNAGASGFYRVRYPADHLRRLARCLADLDALERFMILGDTWASVVADRGRLDDFFLLAEALGDEEDPDVWGHVTGALRFLDHTVDDATRPLLAAYTRSLATAGLRPARLGPPGRRARAHGHPPGPAPGHPRHRRPGPGGPHRAAPTSTPLALAGGAALDPDLASTFVTVAATAGGPAEFETFLELYRHPATPQAESRYLYSLTVFRRSGPGRPGLRAGPHRGPHPERPLRRRPAPGPPRPRSGHLARVEDDWDDLVAALPGQHPPRMLDGVRLLCRGPCPGRRRPGLHRRPPHCPPASAPSTRPSSVSG